MKLKEGVEGTICWKERKLKMCPLDRIPPLMRKNRAREGTLDTGQDTSRHSRPSCRHFKQHTMHCEVKSCWKYKCGQAQAIGKFGIRGSFPFVLDTGHFLPCCRLAKNSLTFEKVKVKTAWSNAVIHGDVRMHDSTKPLAGKDVKLTNSLKGSVCPPHYLVDVLSCQN